MASLFSKFPRSSFPLFTKLYSGSLSPFHRRNASGKTSSQRAFITWKNLTIISITSGGILYWMKSMQNEKELRRAIERRRQIGKSKIGAKFELIDSEKRVFKSEDYLGKWLLLYFGFTHCPDVCPDELEKLTAVVQIINNDPNYPNIIPVFISVDPVRDTPEVVGKYVKEFSSEFIGLTGTAEEIERVCKAFRIYYSAGPADQDNDYIVDHSIIAYLIGPDGKFIDYYGQSANAKECANSIQLHMVTNEKIKNKL